MDKEPHHHHHGHQLQEEEEEESLLNTSKNDYLPSSSPKSELLPPSKMSSFDVLKSQKKGLKRMRMSSTSD